MKKQLLRNTQQRKIILEVLRSDKSHPTAEELYISVKRQLPRISFATVYRNLETLSEHGLVRKLELSERQRHFDGNADPHSHITCTVCKRIEDIPPASNSEPTLSDPLGYIVMGWSILYYGICPECQKKK